MIDNSRLFLHYCTSITRVKCSVYKSNALITVVSSLLTDVTVPGEVSNCNDTVATTVVAFFFKFTSI